MTDYNRLFILGGKGTSEQDWRDTFSEFGTITDVHIVLDRNTREEKGVTYISFAKTSEACVAKEKMNGACLEGQSRALKVMIAAGRSEGAVRDQNEDEKLMRIFVKIPRSFKQTDVEEAFSKFGEIDQIKVLYDKGHEPRGLAYITFAKASQASLALENADSTYKAVWAKKERESYERSRGGGDSSGGRRTGPSPYESHSNYGYGGSYERRERRPPPPRSRELPRDMDEGMGRTPFSLIRDYPHQHSRDLEIMCSRSINQESLYRLVDLVPGLEYCDLDRSTGNYFVRYSSASCAAYAFEKLSKIEYPPGCSLSIRMPLLAHPDNMGVPSYSTSPASQIPDPGYSNFSSDPNASGSGGGALPDSQIVTLVESIKKASEVLEKAGMGSQLNALGFSAHKDEVEVTYCSARLPTRKPFSAPEAYCEDRLFIISQPDGFPMDILEDAFCRFGNLIKAYFLPGRNVAYALYSDKASSQKAMAVLHGQFIQRNKLKVLQADPPNGGAKYSSSSNSSKYDTEDRGPSPKRSRDY